jgi:hypothetical protein
MKGAVGILGGGISDKYFLPTNREWVGNTTLHRWDSTLWTFKRIWGMARKARG